VIDIHSHLLPGVDDGSPSIDVSVEVLQRFGAEGVTSVVCTPHLTATQAAQAPWQAHFELLEALRSAAPTVPTLLLGWEIMLDAPGMDLTGPHLTLGDSRALLVEFTRGGIPRGATEELRRIIKGGQTPVLAHPERYFGCTVELVREWRELGVVIQTDASVLLGRGAPAELARTLLSDGLIDVLASDNHGDHRSLAAVRPFLEERGGEEQLSLLTDVNPRRVLSDEDPVPVPPLRGSWMGRVRRLFGA
jgi:protein-tyrosine phosphatase